MPMKFEVLPTTHAQENNQIMEPSRPIEVIHLDDPAMDIMIDFKTTKPVTISPTLSVSEADDLIKSQEPHLLFVVDEERHFLGIVSAEDLVGEKPIKLMQQRRLSRQEIKAKMVMRPRKEVLAFDIDDIRDTKVGNIINTLKEHRRHYALVVRNSQSSPLENTQLIRGIFSAAEMSKHLHMNVMDFLSSAETIAELQKRHS